MIVFDGTRPAEAFVMGPAGALWIAGEVHNAGGSSTASRQSAESPSSPAPAGPITLIRERGRTHHL